MRVRGVLATVVLRAGAAAIAATLGTGCSPSNTMAGEGDSGASLANRNGASAGDARARDAAPDASALASLSPPASSSMSGPPYPAASPEAGTSSDAGMHVASAAGAAIAVDAASPADAAAGTDANGSGDGATVTAGPTWANWPMPNPTSAGLPNPASYDTSVSGIVFDRVTGLSWQQQETATSATSMADAAANCAMLRLGGFDDWRLPSRIEVWSIQDFTRHDPAIDPVFGTLVGASGRAGAPWTSTPGHGSIVYNNRAFLESTPQTVDFNAGTAIFGANSIRCVRGPTAEPRPHYTLQRGTVFDNGTKLTWEQSYDPNAALPSGALSYCASLSLAGGGWRLPSVKELESIVDDTVVAPTLDPVFMVPSGTTDEFVFHTSSPYAPSPSAGETWTVFFMDGSNGKSDDLTVSLPPLNTANNLLQVRCVR